MDVAIGHKRPKYASRRHVFSCREEYYATCSLIRYYILIWSHSALPTIAFPSPNPETPSVACLPTKISLSPLQSYHTTEIPCHSTVLARVFNMDRHTASTAFQHFSPNEGTDITTTRSTVPESVNKSPRGGPAVIESYTSMINCNGTYPIPLAQSCSQHQASIDLPTSSLDKVRQSISTETLFTRRYEDTAVDMSAIRDNIVQALGKFVLGTDATS